MTGVQAECLPNVDMSTGRPLPKRTPWRLLTFSWLQDLLELGRQRPLQMADVYALPNEFETKTLTAHLSHCLQNGDPGLGRALWLAFGRTWALAGFFKLVSDLATLCTPIVLSLLLSSLPVLNPSPIPGTPTWLKPGLCAVGLFCLMTLSSLALNIYFRLVMSSGLKMRTALNGVLYDKLLRLSHTARSHFSSGHIVQLLSTDTGRIEILAGFLHYIWSGLLQILLIVALLSHWLGPLASLAGLCILLLTIPFQRLMMGALGRLRSRLSHISDERLKSFSENLSGIRVLKYYAWESSLLAKLSCLRQRELGQIFRIQFLKAVSFSITLALPIFSAILTLFIFHIQGGRLTPEIIFPSLVLFNYVRIPLFLFPNTVGMIADAKIAMARISTFMHAEEVDASKQIERLVKDPSLAIRVQGLSFQWTSPKAPSAVGLKDKQDLSPCLKPQKSRPSSKALLENVFAMKGNHSMANLPLPITPPLPPQLLNPPTPQPQAQKAFTLKNIQLQIPRGSLVAIVGPIGSGKSSLLLSLLGEMNLISDPDNKIQTSGSFYYCPQEPFILNASIRENVLFGLGYDAERYERVLRLTDWHTDLRTMGSGDQTEIGERGANLSGGQKARLNFARCLYHSQDASDIFLLDDPLSAVDARVGRHLYERAICGSVESGGLQGRTRLLVTHALGYLRRHVDWLVIMDQGSIAFQGTLSDCLAHPQHAALFKDWIEGTESEPESESESELPSEMKSTPAPPLPWMEVEERAVGSVGRRVYGLYARESGGVRIVCLCLLGLVLSQGLRLMTDWWLSQWTLPHRSDRAFPSLDDGGYMRYYFLLGLGQSLLSLVTSFCFVYGGLNASRSLFSLAVERLLRAPMLFYDTTPLGRILSRLSKDLDMLDNGLPDTLRSFCLMLAQTLFTFLLMSIVAVPFLGALLPLCYVYYRIQRTYRSSARELKRLESISRSPLISHYSESLAGWLSICTLHRESYMIERQSGLSNENNRPFYCQLILQRWLALRLETIGSALVFFVALVCLIFETRSELTGLALSYALSTTGVLAWTVRQAADTEIQMNSVERLAHYAYALPQEPLRSSESVDLPLHWPCAGAIVFDSVCLRYRPGLPLSLLNLSFSVAAGERVGIVGRTGAGKSSIMTALFRLVDPESGSIRIDGVDIVQGQDPRDIRQGLAVIPQDPVLFSGTLRSNLDPYMQYSDHALWDALEKASLKSTVRSLPQGQGLETVVSEKGTNFSVGQRQLFCLARALLKNAKILVLDEATANVDYATDALIQRSIRGPSFKGITVLTIAHRLSTIIDYDKILVLDQGKLVEFDRPRLLVAQPKGALSSLIGELSEKQVRQLMAMIDKAEKLKVNDTMTHSSSSSSIDSAFSVE